MYTCGGREVVEVHTNTTARCGILQSTSMCECVCVCVFFCTFACIRDLWGISFDCMRPIILFGWVYKQSEYCKQRDSQLTVGNWFIWL